MGRVSLKHTHLYNTTDITVMLYSGLKMKKKYKKMYTGPLHPIFLNNRPAAHYFFKFQITVTQAFLIIARTEMGSHSLVLIAIQVMTIKM